MQEFELTEREFRQFQQLIFEIAGITLPETKKLLVVGRLSRRLRHYGLTSFADYYRLIAENREPGELQTMVDLLTTNETYFFREPKHFQFLREAVLPTIRPGRSFSVWSAASSSGEEAYSIAMLLADRLGDGPWDILGSDISLRVLERARAGHYPMTRIEGIPPDYLTRFCLKGTGTHEGTILISQPLRSKVKFTQINLNAPLPEIGPFDVIFLRNVMIYFNQETKRKTVANLIRRLKPGGYLFIGHSETLNGVTDAVNQVKPAIFKKP